MKLVQVKKSPATLREAAVAQLRDAIVRGKLAPGVFLKEAELASKLGLSVTPVREALGELAGEGLVEIKPNRRKRVAPIDFQAMVELIEVQYRLWGLGYEWGAHRVGPAELKRLRAAHRSYAKAFRVHDIASAIAAVYSFHRVVLDASGNRELARISMDRFALIQRFLLLCVPSIPASDDLAYPHEMLRALERGDADLARAIYHDVGSVLLTAAKTLRDAQLNLNNTEKPAVVSF